MGPKFFQTRFFCIRLTPLPHTTCKAVKQSENGPQLALCFKEGDERSTTHTRAGQALLKWDPDVPMEPADGRTPRSGAPRELVRDQLTLTFLL